jgi:hypothetical protein
MDGFNAFLAAQSRTASVADSARPDSPIVPDRPRHDLRLRISMAIRRLADRIDPGPPPTRTRRGVPGMADGAR